MARRGQTPPEPQPANLSVEDMKAGIRKLERRLGELQAFDMANLDPDDPEIDKLANKIEMTMVEVFGKGTIEYDQFRVYSLYGGGSIVMSVYGGRDVGREIRAYQEGFAKAIAQIESARDVLIEKLDDLGEAPGAQALRAFEGHELHQTIEGATSRLFRDRYYAEATFAACKALNNLVQNASGVFDQDGDTLMRKVFSANNPILSFNDMDDKWDEGEQRGFMELYAGAIGAFRNQRGHKFIEDDPDFAPEVIGFISFLAKLLDKADRAEV